MSGVKDESRRWFLGAGSAFAAVLAAHRVWGQTAADGARSPGGPLSPYGARSRFDTDERLVPPRPLPGLGGSWTPLANSYGIITPSALHFERHHAGVPEIDPRTHTVTLQGLVERPLAFSMADLQRLPSVSRVYFVECAGNSSSEWAGAGAPDVQRTHGLMSCSEWTGVRLATLLREAGVRTSAQWLLAEGADACRMARSIPLAKAMDDVLVAFGQNGEALRPEQGFPVRLIVPGWEGNVSVKWLHRIELLDQPAMTRWETARYSDLLPDGTARQFTFDMEVKSVITKPSGGQRLERAGVYEVTGLAWSGRGAIRRVDVTADGGQTWTAAELQPPVLPRAFTRFRHTWRWDGGDALLASRAEDDTGAVQPPIPELLKARGINHAYHQHGIQVWQVARDGAVTNGNG
jgi:sulfane dehydrogenase subunit SoxC